MAAGGGSAARERDPARAAGAVAAVPAATQSRRVIRMRRVGYPAPPGSMLGAAALALPAVAAVRRRPDGRVAVVGAPIRTTLRAPFGAMSVAAIDVVAALEAGLAVWSIRFRHGA